MLKNLGKEKAVLLVEVRKGFIFEKTLNKQGRVQRRKKALAGNLSHGSRNKASGNKARAREMERVSMGQGK